KGFRDRHRHAAFLGKLMSGLCGPDTLDDHSHTVEHFIETLAFAEHIAGPPVSGMDARTGDNQVTQAGKAGESKRIGAHRHSEAGDLGKAARNEGSFGIVAIAESVGHARCKSNDVFQRTADFHAYYVIVCIDTE